MNNKIVNVMDYVSEEEKQKQYPDITEAFQKTINKVNGVVSEKEE